MRLHFKVAFHRLAVLLWVQFYVYLYPQSRKVVCRSMVLSVLLFPEELRSVWTTKHVDCSATLWIIHANLNRREVSQEVQSANQGCRRPRSSESESPRDLRSGDDIIQPKEWNGVERELAITWCCLLLSTLDTLQLLDSNMPKAIAVRKVDGKPGQVYYPLDLIDLPDQKPKDDQVVVKITAAALNHRDLFVRQHLYPAIAFGIPLLADGCGVVVDAGSSAQKWKGRRVILNPGTGWKDDPDGPESPKGYAILGGTKSNPNGTLAEKVTIDASELEEAPSHLSDAEAAALPLTGLTAWRAVMVKSANAKPGRNILITGIGGGVALMALFFAVAAGANVYVSSGSEEKLKKAKALGATGGINYKEKDWEKKLRDQLPTDRKYLDAIIDGAGGDIVEKGVKLLKVRCLASSTFKKSANRCFRLAVSSQFTA